MVNAYELPKREVMSFIDRLSDIQSESTDKVIRLADEYGVSRDDAMDTFSYGISLVTSKVSFENYEIEEEQHEEHDAAGDAARCGMGL